MFGRFVVILLLVAGISTCALGATYTVTKVADTDDGICNNDCSIREAINQSNQTGALDTIVFSSLFASPQTINLSLPAGDLDLTNSVTILGPGARLLTINQTLIGERVFDVAAGTAVELFRVSVQGGRPSNDGTQGGGIRSAGSLTLQEVAISGNSSNSFGGGIYTQGSFSALDCSFQLNTVGLGAPAGVPNGAGIFVASGVATIGNSTFAGNVTRPANSSGGAIAAALGSTLNLNNVTVAVNQADGSGGGISAADATVNLRNSIIADNIAGDPTAKDLYTSNPATAFVSNGNNLVEMIPLGYGIINGLNGDIVGIDPLLGPYTNNGGPTDTFDLLPNSPAIDSGNNCVLTGTCGANNTRLVTDQRGLSRLQGPNVDIGAVEDAIPTAAGVDLNGRVTDGTQGIGGARVVLVEADGTTTVSITNPFGYFRFVGIEAGQVVVISVIAKSYVFEPIVLNLQDEVAGLEIMPVKSPSAVEKTWEGSTRRVSKMNR